ncbi:MAG: hypothetical protein GQ574_22735 [Crocinitomix sp.]|nr:hypothetical protein [Crocinitomix sp.]
MKYKLAKILFVLLCFSHVYSCKKDSTVTSEEQLPPMTHEGKNTFGCKVNGKIWIPEASFTIGGSIAIDKSYNELTGGFWIEATKKNKEDDIFEYMKFYGVNLHEVDLYEMSVLNADITGFNDITNVHYSCGGFKHDTLNKGILNITYLNKEDNIIAGTFSMKLISSDYCAETTYLDITDGRFDLRY